MNSLIPDQGLLDFPFPSLALPEIINQLPTGPNHSIDSVLNLTGVAFRRL